MSASHPPIFVSVTKLEYRERNVTDDNVACYLFLNSKPISVFKISDPHHFVSISVSSPDDILQFIFQTDDQNEAIGCVSFLLKNLLNSSSGQYSQWVTLFDDPEDDIFDGVLGENDEEWPRSLITFDVQDRSLNVSKVATPQKERILSNEASPVKDATQETLMDFSGDLMSHRSHYPPVFSEQNPNTSFKIHIVPTGPTTNDGENVDIVPDFPSSENPLPMEKEILYQSGGGTQEVLTQPESIIKYSTFREKHLVTEAERRKETFGTSFEFNHDESKVDGNRGLLEKKMADMRVAIENLEREKTLLKKNEQTYHLKLNHSRIEVEKLKFNKENYENTIQELEEKLTQERSLRILLEKEKESFTERNGEKKKRSERDSPNQLKCYEPLFSHKERKYKEEIESLQKQNAQLKSDWKLAKTQVDCDESIIQNLQKEIHSLRQKNTDTAATVVGEKDNEYYDQKIQALMDICSVHLFNNSQNMEFDSLEEFIEKFQGEMQIKNKEMAELKNTNEGLQLKLSVCENKMLADSLWNQINSFKQQIATLEKERDKLKNELSKTNDNYIKLTNKYTELTDVLAELQRPVQRLLKSNSKASVSPTPNRSSGKMNPQQTYRFENADETELKMMEFLNQHNLQPSLFQRVEKNVYIYNRRKLFIRLVKGKLVVKIGVGFKPLQEFLRIEESFDRTPPRQKRFNTEFDKSFEGSRHNKSEISHVLATEPSYRDYSPSGSFIRENMRDLSYREYDNDKGRRKSKVREKFQEITSSKSVERRISFNLYQPESSRNYGRLTPI